MSQILWYPVFWLLTYVVCRAQVARAFTMPADRRIHYVIAANHLSRLDPFVIAGVLPPNYWRRLFPCRFITANQYLYHPMYSWLLWPLGGFPAYQTGREGWGLEEAERLVRDRQTVCIFPEGQRALQGDVEPKRGVAILAQQPGVHIIPIHLAWHNRRVRVVVGESYRAEGQSSADIMNHIYHLMGKYYPARAE